MTALAPAVASLPERLRLATRALHQATERSGAMAALLAGRLPREGYVALLRSLHALYAALEAALPTGGPSPHPALDALCRVLPAGRAAALADDLNALHGPTWPTAWAPMPAALAYAQRLQSQADAASPRLAAHAYVRYLGDLHGGQVLQRLVRRHYGFEGEAGTRFFDFGPEPQVLALRQALRDALDRLPLQADEAEAVVDEACWAFRQHQQLFEELPH